MRLEIDAFLVMRNSGIVPSAEEQSRYKALCRREVELIKQTTDAA